MDNLYEKYGSTVRIHPVEVQINNLSGKYFFPDDSILRNETIIGLAVVPPTFDEEGAAYLTLNSPETDRPLLGVDGFYNAYVSLLDNNILIINNQPLSYYAIQPGDREVQQIYTTSFTPSKSYITIADPTAGGRISAGQSVVLHFFYLGKN